MRSYITILAVGLLSCLSLSCFAVCPSMDLTGDCRVNFADFAVLANQWQTNYDSNDLAAMASEWLTVGTQPIVWVDVNDPGILGHEGFNGQMSKYETTNAQYCEFLNAAKDANLITVYDNKVYAANDVNYSQPYYDLAVTVNGGNVRIDYNSAAFSADPNFENHPAACVSWYGATAFCNYYNYRLPSEWEWMAVADYNGSYIYGCGTTIDSNMANYFDSNHPDGTTVVGAFGTYGYGICDMAGNIWEWTTSGFVADSNIMHFNICGGSWYDSNDMCMISATVICEPNQMFSDVGFRVCRGERVQTVVPNVIDMPLADADASIADAHLAVGNITYAEEYNNFIPWGSVISSDPVAGSTVDAGTAVNLILSKGPELTGMEWVYIYDESDFSGQISKYEMTNAQYCQFLNKAKATGDITVSGNNVLGAHGLNIGADFAGQVYYNLAGAGVTFNGATLGGAARINYSGGVFSVDPNFENHPVTYVSWYGSTALCNYYGFRLPTELEWQEIADFDGSYTYGCGTAINNSKANYYGSTHPNGTTAIGAFGTYGYGVCDMAGNVWEWTSSVYTNDTRVIRGGAWYNYASFCTVSSWDNYSPDLTDCSVGFRVCR